MISYTSLFLELLESKSNNNQVIILFRFVFVYKIHSNYSLALETITYKYVSKLGYLYFLRI